jgi:hypothetical protein
MNNVLAIPGIPDGTPTGYQFSPHITLSWLNISYHGVLSLHLNLYL